MSTKKAREAEKAIANSQGRAMVHSDGHLGNRHGTQRPIHAIDVHLVRTANVWFAAYLPGYCLADLERGLEQIKRHPDQARPGFSKAKNARQRLEMELARRRAAPAA